MSVNRRLFLLIAAALVLAGMGGYTVYWFHVAGQLRKGVTDFAAQRRAEGWRVEMGGERLFGFPRRVGLDLGAVRLVTPQGAEWSSDGLRLLVPGLDPLGPEVELGSVQTLRLGDWRGMVGAKTSRVRLRVDGDGDLHAFAFEAEQPLLEQADGGPLSASHLAVDYEWLRPAAAGGDQPSARFSVAARGVVMSLPAGLPLNNRLEDLRLDGRIMGTIPEEAALAAWSNAGGNVEFSRFAATWEPLELEGDGTLAFDPHLQPLVATTAHIRGWRPMLDRLSAARLVEPGAAEAAGFLLAILARPDPQGRSTLTLAVTLQDGYLYAGQLKLLQVPPLPIPAPGPGAAPP
jgi:hypothetical protein